MSVSSDRFSPPNMKMADRFLDELDNLPHKVQHSRTSKVWGGLREKRGGHQGIKVCHGLNSVDRFLGWLFSKTIEVKIGDTDYVFGHDSAKEFLLRHKDLAGITKKGDLGYDDILKGLTTLLNHPQVRALMNQSQQQVKVDISDLTSNQRQKLQLYKDCARAKTIVAKSFRNTYTVSPGVIQQAFSQLAPRLSVSAALPQLSIAQNQRSAVVSVAHDALQELLVDATASVERALQGVNAAIAVEEPHQLQPSQVPKTARALLEEEAMAAVTDPKNFAYCSSNFRSVTKSEQAVYDKAKNVVLGSGSWGTQSISRTGNQLPHAAVVLRFKANIVDSTHQKLNAQFLNGLKNVPEKEKPLLVKIAQTALSGAEFTTFMQLLLGEKTY